jgi:serine/threonine protein kinase
MKYIDITSNKQKIYIGNEITIMKSMDTKNIVKLHEVYMYKGRIFMIMEYMDGGCVTPVVEDMKLEIPEPIIAFIRRETVMGIAELHKRGIIHRDIKSDNVLIERGTASIKLTDFGYSCQLTQEKRMRESRVGTLYWMAPEILKGNNLYDERCDVWSLGVFAFELAEHYPPFPKKGQQKTIYNILSKPPPELKNKKKWSENFHSFIETCMVKDPEQRPRARDLLKHPFLADFDYEEVKQQYIEFKDQVLKDLGKITEDFEEVKYEGFETNLRQRSKTFKQV